MFNKQASPERPVIAWWSGGITSAVTCKLCVDWFGADNVRIIFIDTGNEGDDIYQFKDQCSKWYGKYIETISQTKYRDIRHIWYQFQSLNVATGAICSTHLKRAVRDEFQRNNLFSYQAFGYDVDEIPRARAMKLNYPDINPIFPLIASILTKKDCLKIITKANDLFLRITIPQSYLLGYGNNNCMKTMCVQGGVGYWQKVRVDFPDKFMAMAKVEHDLTDMKGEPVTMLKDQSKGGGLVFLVPHPKYPDIKDISMMEGRPPKPLIDCNGFCGTNDLIPAKELPGIDLNYSPIKV